MTNNQSILRLTLDCASGEQVVIEWVSERNKYIDYGDYILQDKGRVCDVDGDCDCAPECMSNVCMMPIELPFMTPSNSANPSISASISIALTMQPSMTLSISNTQSILPSISISPTLMFWYPVYSISWDKGVCIRGTSPPPGFAYYFSQVECFKKNLLDNCWEHALWNILVRTTYVSNEEECALSKYYNGKLFAHRHKMLPLDAIHGIGSGSAYDAALT